MDNKKAAFVIIIIMLAISVPCSLIGIGYKIYLANKPVEAPPPKVNYDFYQNGTLNFYSYGELMGKYVCKNPNGYCGWAFETLDDNQYNVNYYDDNSIDNIEFIANRFAFLLDEEEFAEDYEGKDIILYDVIENKEVGIYKGVKDYTIGINNNYYIVKNEQNLWGVIQLTSDGFTEIIPCKYDYIGLQNKTNESTAKIISNSFVVLLNEEWFLIDLNGNQLSTPIANPIMSYNEDSMIVNYYSRESLFDFHGKMLLSGQVYSYIDYVKNYVCFINNEGKFAIIDYNSDTLITKDYYPIALPTDLEFINNPDGSVDIYISGEYKETIQ